MPWYVWLTIGLFAGTALGLLVAGMMAAGKRGDEIAWQAFGAGREIKSESEDERTWHGKQRTD